MEGTVSDIFKRFTFNSTRFEKDLLLSDLHYELSNSPLGGILVKECGHDSSHPVLDSNKATERYLNLSLYESYTIVKELSRLIVDC